MIEANAQPDFSGKSAYVSFLNDTEFDNRLGVVRAYVRAFLKRAQALV